MMDIVSFGGDGFLMSYYLVVCIVLQSRFNFINTKFEGGRHKKRVEKI